MRYTYLFTRSSQYRGEALRLRVVLLDADLRLLGNGGHAATPGLAEEEQLLRPRPPERFVRLGLLRVREAKRFCTRDHCCYRGHI